MFWAQCLLNDAADNITESVRIDGNRLTVDGLVLRRFGHISGDSCVEHEPALILKTC